MRKLLFLPMIAVLFCAGFCAFGDTVRGGRSIANSISSSETTTETTENTEKNTGAMAARAANRNRAKQVNNTTTARVATRTTAARSAKKTTAATTTGGNVSARAARNVAPAKTSGVVSARAATKQKAVNMGTKVATANENTMIPQECQDSFYGCMDSFCMLDNVSGGRCRCDDRSEELDDVLEKIMKLDAQSKTLAEEGVERLQRGDAADAIEAMAEDAANKVVAGQKKNQKTLSGLEGGNTSKKLDLSIFTNNMFDTDDLMGEDPFGVTGDFSDKTGTALRNAATKLCGSKMPDQCKEYGSMLQMVYAQKVKSDCVAYENDLKQQRMNSENLLKTAQKAVRDAAAEQYANKNKYKTVGECVIPFKQCMLGEDVCGAGFSKCVVNKLVVSKTAKSKAIKTGTTTIDIDATTYDAVNGKKDFCNSVLEQCVNVRDKVWNAFLIDVAPELRAAEFSAEDEQRRGCAKNIVNCVKEAASAEGLQEGTDSWAIFTSNMQNVENICKVQLDQCGAYDTNIKESLLNYVRLSLDAIRADRCTTSIRNCFQKEDNCGKDYSQCIGVSNDAMWGMCEESVTVDCEGKGNVKDYVVRVAQGLLLNIDSALADACRKVIDSAMTSACGSTDSCSSKIEGVSEQIIADHFKYMVCPANYEKETDCVFGKEAVDKSKSGWHVVIEPTGTFEINNNNNLLLKLSGEPFVGTDTQLVAAVNAAYKTIKDRVDGYPHVQDCIKGREWQGFSNNKLTIKLPTNSRRVSGFSNLTSSAEGIIIQSLYNAVTAQLQAKKEDLEDKRAEDTTSLQEASSEKKAEEEETAEAGQCAMGNCNACTESAEQKCKCIAATYFQYGPMRHRTGKTNYGEYTVIRDEPKMAGGECVFSFNRVHGCGDGATSGDFFKGRCQYGVGTSDKKIVVRFPLKADTKVSISACMPSNSPWDGNRGYMDTLTIGDTKIDFKHCSETSKPLEYRELYQQPERGEGACFWCSLDDLQKHPDTNSPVVTKPGGGEDKSGDFYSFP